jgi:hypothetical protein
MVPVVAVHVAGEAAVTVGAAGAVGAAPTVTEVAAEVHPPAFLTVTLYVPGGALNVPVVFVYVVPSMEYVIPAAGAGAVTTILPFATAQDAGPVAVTVGAAGAVGAAPIVTDVAGEVQPAAFFAVTEYVPGAALKMPVVFVYVVPSIE